MDDNKLHPITHRVELGMANYHAGTTGTSVTHAIPADAASMDPEVIVMSLCGEVVRIDPTNSFRTSPLPCRQCLAKVSESDRMARA